MNERDKPTDRALDSLARPMTGCGIANPCAACRSEDGTEGFDAEADMG